MAKTATASKNFVVGENTNNGEWRKGKKNR